MSRRLTEHAQQIVAQVLGPGAQALDATLGNGYDTEFLARAVAAAGHVYGCDAQAAAVRCTRERLARQGFAARATLWHAGHERLAQLVPAGVRGRIDAAMLNLGYLPGSDKSVVTRVDTTVAALAAIWRMLRPGARLSVIAYRGHAVGPSEAAAVLQWMRTVQPQHQVVEPHSRKAWRSAPPVLLWCER